MVNRQELPCRNSRRLKNIRIERGSQEMHKICGLPARVGGRKRYKRITSLLSGCVRGSSARCRAPQLSWTGSRRNSPGPFPHAFYAAVPASLATAGSALALSRRSLAGWSRFSFAASTSAFSCSTLVALAIGAMIPGCAMTHASARVAGASGPWVKSEIGSRQSLSFRSPVL